MKKRSSLALSILLGVSLLSANDTQAAEDISSHWAKQSLTYAIENGILKGDDNGNINPDKSITRAEFASILVRSLKLQPSAVPITSYKDVKKGAWYEHDIQLASQYKLIYGDDQGRFNPNANITREEMAVMILRAVNHYGYDTLSLNLLFKDVEKISPWAKSSIAQLLSLAIMNGKTEDTFSPKDSTTRAEAVTVLERFLKIDPTNPIKVGQQYTAVKYDIDFAEAVKIQANAKQGDAKADHLGDTQASEALVAYYLNPAKYTKLDDNFYQFLKLDGVVAGINAGTINKNTFNNPNSILYNMAQTFINAGSKYNINALYLMAHSYHETGNGTSVLAKGVEIGLDTNGKHTVVTQQNRALLHSIKKVYNLYGYGANDGVAVTNGGKFAYERGWTTPELAIDGAANLISTNYIHHKDYAQNTLYKMKWNPDKPGTHQYATHVIWADTQAKKIAEFYRMTGADRTTVAVFEVPSYLNAPAETTLPARDDWYAIDTKEAGKTAVTTEAVNFRQYPVDGLVYETIPAAAEVTIIGRSNKWYKVNYNGKIGWIISTYLTVK